MRTITKTFNLYEFEELSEKAKEKAIDDYINSEIEMGTLIQKCQVFFKDAIDEAERLQNPWLLQSIIDEKYKDEIINTMKINDYLFFKNGDLIPLSYYPEL